MEDDSQAGKSHEVQWEARQRERERVEGERQEGTEQLEGGLHEHAMVRGESLEGTVVPVRSEVRGRREGATGGRCSWSRRLGRARGRREGATGVRILY